MRPYACRVPILIGLGEKVSIRVDGRCGRGFVVAGEEYLEQLKRTNFWIGNGELYWIVQNSADLFVDPGPIAAIVGIVG